MQLIEPVIQTRTLIITESQTLFSTGRDIGQTHLNPHQINAQTIQHATEAWCISLVLEGDLGFVAIGQIEACGHQEDSENDGDRETSDERLG
jgi:hypothetical protein